MRTPGLSLRADGDENASAPHPAGATSVAQTVSRASAAAVVRLKPDLPTRHATPPTLQPAGATSVAQTVSRASGAAVVRLKPDLRACAALPTQGFTLIELMVVMVIIGIAASLAVINFGALERRETADEIERLQRVLQFASERAAVRGTPIQVEFLPGSYRFSRLDTGGKWQLLFQPRELAEREWRGGLAVHSLSVDEQLTTPGTQRLVFASEPTPFVLQLRSPEGLQQLVGNAAGEVRQASPESGGPG